MLAFLGHTIAKDLYEEFITVLNNDILQAILQVSMDGPSVNEKFLMHLMMTLRKNMRPGFWKCGHMDCMWYIELSKMAIRMQFGKLILF